MHRLVQAVTRDRLGLHWKEWMEQARKKIF
jgi:hypothetical protein